MYYFVEACIALLVSFVINVFVVAVFADGLYKKTNLEVVSTRNNRELHIILYSVFIFVNINIHLVLTFLVQSLRRT